MKNSFLDQQDAMPHCLQITMASPLLSATDRFLISTLKLQALVSFVSECSTKLRQKIVAVFLLSLITEVFVQLLPRIRTSLISLLTMWC